MSKNRIYNYRNPNLVSSPNYKNSNADKSNKSINSNKCNICSNKAKHSKICKYCHKIYCFNCINKWLQNFSFCKICNHKITLDDIINSSFIKINLSKENFNSHKDIYDKKLEYYCINCNKNYLFSDEEKKKHLDHLLIPHLKIYEKKDIMIYIQEFRKKITELTIKLNEEKKNKITKEEKASKRKFKIDNLKI